MSYQRPSFWRVPRNKPEPVGRKVAFSSPVANSLQRGDIISKIGNYDARDVRHQDAQNLFRNAGTNIQVVVQRDMSNKHNTSTASSRCSSHTPLSMSPNLSPRGPQAFNSPGSGSNVAPPHYQPVPTLQPYLPTTPTEHMTEGYFREVYPGQKPPKRPEDDEFEHVVNQPYRTTPLVLPGAKVKHETGITESYLRHHPNPAVRSSPHHIDHEHLMKQRVNIVHKQFNSPIGIYSEPNIVNTIKQTAGLNPANGTHAIPEKSKKFDPSLSETYKYLQEEQHGENVHEVPVQTRVFTPNKVIPGKKPLPYQQPPAPQPYVNALGNAGDIQQSGSFKRLMYHVMAESSF